MIRSSLYTIQSRNGKPVSFFTKVSPASTLFCSSDASRSLIRQTCPTSVRAAPVVTVTALVSTSLSPPSPSTLSNVVTTLLTCRLRSHFWIWTWLTDL
ncbi:hypothetical protein BGZ82_009613 [Podila clonocystis]|nr:hypothetical protein BGZ82_009613 [Podila clonocystis]